MGLLELALAILSLQASFAFGQAAPAVRPVVSSQVMQQANVYRRT